MLRNFRDNGPIHLNKLDDYLHSYLFVHNKERQGLPFNQIVDDILLEFQWLHKVIIRVVHASFFREISSFDIFGVGRSFWDPDEIGNV